MTEDDLINLKHDVGRHESDLDRQSEQIQKLEKRLSELDDELKKHISDHKRDMVDLVILVRTLYSSFSAQNGWAVHPLQSEIIKRLNDLHSRFEINPP